MDLAGFIKTASYQHPAVLSFLLEKSASSHGQELQLHLANQDKFDQPADQ